MANIGNSITQQGFTPAVDLFSGNGSTTSFTLSRPVASVAQVEAVIENVVQSPYDAYTVNGNTITFTSAPPSGSNNIYVRYTSLITQVIAPSDGSVGTNQLMTGSVTQTKLGANVVGNGPSFHVSYVGSLTFSANTWTKCPLNTKQWDTASAFDATTNYRFQPAVAGYYSINVINGQLISGTVYVQIYKNGNPYQQFGGAANATGTSIVYLNGSTDYVEMWFYCTSGATQNGTGVFTAMNGSLVRAA